MRPMALNVPVTMLMSMVVAFTITPWLAYHVLKRKYSAGGAVGHTDHDPHDLDAVKQSRLYKVFYPLMAPLLAFAAGGLVVPARHGPLDRRGDGPGGHAQRAAEDAALRQQERTAPGAGLRQGHHAGTLGRRGPRLRGLSGRRARGLPITPATSGWPRRWTSTAWCGTTTCGKATTSPRCRSIWRARRIADSKATPSACGCETSLQAIADRHHARMKLVETPPGPPVIASVVAEVYGQPDHRYEDLLLAADAVRARLAVEPGVVDVDHVREAAQQKLIFVSDKEKAALNGITTRADRRNAAIALGKRHGRPGAERHRAQSAADRVAAFPSIGGPVPRTWPKSKSKAAPANWSRWPSWDTGRRPASTR